MAEPQKAFSLNFLTEEMNDAERKYFDAHQNYLRITKNGTVTENSKEMLSELENLRVAYEKETFLEVTENLLNDLAFEALNKLRNSLRNPNALPVFRNAGGAAFFSIKIASEVNSFQLTWQIPQKLIKSVRSVSCIRRDDPRGRSWKRAVADLCKIVNWFLNSTMETFGQAASDAVTITQELSDIEERRNFFWNGGNGDYADVESSGKVLIAEKSIEFAKNSQHNAKRIFTRAARVLPADDPEKLNLFEVVYQNWHPIWKKAKGKYTKIKRTEKDWQKSIAGDDEFLDLPIDLIQKIDLSEPGDLAMEHAARECGIGAAAPSTLKGYRKKSKNWMEKTPIDEINRLLRLYGIPKPYHLNIVELESKITM